MTSIAGSGPAVRLASHARYYDASTGQFLTVDPDVPATHSPYSYMKGDPLNGTDAAGLGGPNPSACPSGFALPDGGRCEKVSITISNDWWLFPWSSDNFSVKMISAVWYDGGCALWLESAASTSFESPMGVYYAEMGGYRSDSSGDLSVWGNIEAWDTSFWTPYDETEFILVWPRILVHPNGTYQCSGGASEWYGEAEIEATSTGGITSCK
jgi:hypothetical protein